MFEWWMPVHDAMLVVVFGGAFLAWALWASRDERR